MKASFRESLSIKSAAANIVRRIRGRLLLIPLVSSGPPVLAWRVCVSMVRDDAAHQAAGVAYYALFSLFPLLLGFLSIMGMVLHSPELQRDFIVFVTNNLPGLEEFVASNVHEIVEFRGILGAAALFGLFWSGTAVFAAISRTVNRVWGVEHRRPFYIAKPLQMGLALLLGILFLLSTAASSFIRIYINRDLGFPGQGFFMELGLEQLVLYLIPWGISLVIFLFIYWFVPNCKTYWRYIWLGALVAAALFEASKFIFAWYLENVAVYSQLYGSLASVMALLFWAYFSSLIVIMGAVINVEYERLHHPLPSDGSTAPLA